MTGKTFNINKRRDGEKMSYDEQFPTLLKNKEHIRLLIYLIITSILIFPLMDMFVRSWNIKYSLIRWIAACMWNIDPDAISIFVTLVAGFYVSSVVLMFLDIKKRLQAMLLGIGILIIIGFILEGIIISNISWSEFILSLVIGCLSGFYLGEGFEKKREFRKASRNVSIISTYYIILMFLNIYMSPFRTGNLLEDTAVMISFIFLFGEVVSYEIKGPKIFILGPKNSGKTLFLAGCYIKALEASSGPIKPSQYLLELIEELHREGTFWPSYTSDIRNYEFVYEAGKLFPKETTIKTIDYPGPYLEKIVEYIDKKDIRKHENEDNGEDEKYLYIARDVQQSDKLIFIIDGKRYPNFGDMGIIHYIKIVDKLREIGRKFDSYVVVTKSDVFKDECDTEDYDVFKKYIEEKLSHNIHIRQLINETTNASFYPVYYYTNKTSDGYIPMKDRYGNVFTYGFDKFMEDLIK